MEKAVEFLEQLDKKLEKYPALINLEKQIGVPKAKSYVVLGLAAIYLLLIFFNVAGSLLTNLLGFLYPAYASFKAIESPEKDDDTQWLTYWTVFGFCSIIEYFTDILLYWLPFYFLLKSALIIYMVLPQFRGAHLIYVRFLRPVLLQNMGAVDSTADKIKRAVTDTVKND